jgi:hypothetical protein
MLDTLKTEAARPESVLKEFYNRNGCVRIRPDDPEKGRHGGVELRLVVGDMPERKNVLGAMKSLNLPHGKVYRKQKTRRQWVIPIYARADILSFLKIVKPKNATALSKRVQATAKRRTAAERAM